jgi:hypothetical protein
MVITLFRQPFSGPDPSPEALESDESPEHVSSGSVKE